MRRLLVLTVVLCTALTSVASAATVEPRVVGGSAVANGNYPWQAALLTPAGWQYCGGTLVAPQWVLTADHCDVYLGDRIRVNSVMRGSGGEVRTVDQVLRHELSDGRDEFATARYDVNLLHLSEPVADPHPVRIVGAGDDALWASGKPLTVSGWGATSAGGSGSSTMRETVVPRVSDASCALSYPAEHLGGLFNAEDMLCAGYPEGGRDTCQGDSGGPILAPSVAQPRRWAAADWVLVGVTSWGFSCAEAGYPGVYARLANASINSWIVSTIGAYAAYPDVEPVADDREDETPVKPVEPAAPVDLAPAAPVVPVVTEQLPATPPVPVSAPVATPPVTVEADPRLEGVTRRCTRARRCTFTVSATAGVTGVRARLKSTVKRACVKRGRRTTCLRTTTKTLRARRTAAASFLVTAKLPKGRHTLTVTALDRGGVQDASRRVAFSVR